MAKKHYFEILNHLHVTHECDERRTDKWTFSQKMPRLTTNYDVTLSKVKTKQQDLML